MTRRLKEFVKQAPPLGLADAEFLPDHVCVLLSLNNGAALLPDQLGALAAQSHQNWSLIISDDGSTDSWQATVTQFAESTARGKTWIMGGMRRGHQRNFLSLALAAGPSVPFVAFCDQRDVWFTDKLANAVEQLGAVPDNTPGLYCSRQVICNRDFDGQMFSENPKRDLTFQNALVQDPLSLGTVVLNRCALDLVQDTIRHIRDQAKFDGWVFQLIAGAGGEIIYDETPSQFHRRFRSKPTRRNSRLQRLQPVRTCTAARLAALHRSRHWLTPTACNTLDQFAIAQKARLPRRLAALRRSGVYGQTRRGTFSLWAAAALNRL